MNLNASVSFSGMSELFENTDFMKISMQVSVEVQFSEYDFDGATDEMFDLMIGKNVKLHIPDNKGNWHYKITDAYIKVLEKFLMRYGDSIIYITRHGDAPNEKVIDIIEDSGIKDINYGDMMGLRCNNLDREIRNLSSKKKGRCICTMGKSSCLSSICMLDGALGLCCNDYALDIEIGNILDNDWNQIYKYKNVK